MPTVSGTEFPYSKQGIAKAKAWAEMTGKPMKMKKSYQRGGLASMGRRGDTAIRPVAGRRSHVNDIEAGMIDMLGPAVGGQFAKDTTDFPGSRNPETGLPEYSWLSKRLKVSKKAKRALKKAKTKIKSIAPGKDLKAAWNRNIKPIGKMNWSTMNTALKKNWDKHIKHGAVIGGLRSADEKYLGGRLSKAVTVPERYKRMSWKHATKMKPMDFLAMRPGWLGSMAATKAQKMYGSQGLRGDIGPAAPDPYVDPNLFGARQRFGRGQGIADLQAELMGGQGPPRQFQLGGEVLKDRRMYGQTPRRRRPEPEMQTSQQGMPMRGSAGLPSDSPLMYKKGGKVKYHV